MAFTWPVDLDTYLFGTGPAKVFMRTWRLSESSRTSGTQGGDNWTVSRGTRLWYGNIQIVRQRTKDQQGLEARMEQLNMAGASFLIRDFMADPLSPGAGAPVLRSIAANNVDISFQGMTPGLVVPAGTPFGYTYSGGSRAYHKILTQFTVNPDGTTPVFQVVPALRPGYVVGTTLIQMLRPKLKAKLIPGSLDMGESDATNSSAIKFDWIQTLGAD